MNCIPDPITCFSVSYLMAAVDFIPVILFMVAMGFVIKMAYHRIKTAFFAILTGGVFVAFLGGLAKCTWKLLYAHGIDFVPLDTAFVLYQTVGFLLIAVGTIALLASDIRDAKAKKATISLQSSFSVPFIITAVVIVVIERPSFLWFIFMALFTCTYLIVLSIIAFRHKMTGTGLLFYASMLFMFGMVGLRSQFDEGGAWESLNWVAQVCNSITQLLLLVPCYNLCKRLNPSCSLSGANNQVSRNPL